MPDWINIAAITAFLTAVFFLLVWKLAITIIARANKADHTNAFAQSLVGLVGLGWAFVALGGTAISVIGFGVYSLLFKEPAP